MSKDPPSVTMMVVLAAALFLAIYDVYAATRWGREGTISYDVLHASYRHPIIPFAVGILCGHLFWPQR